MILRSLRLLSFRAHQETEVAFAPKVNVIYGPNGAGKTNLLEAIHYLCLTKSFTAPLDRYALRKGCPYFEVEGRFEGERRPELKVRLVYVPSEGKRIFVNGAPLERLSDVVGMLPVVVLAPEDYALTSGGPEERRRLLNNILSQARPVYLDDVLKYRRALRQRNELLMQHRRRKSAPSPSLLASWDAELVMLGSRIIASRHAFVQTFSAFLQKAFAQIEQVAERPTVEYVTVAPLSSDVGEEEIAERFWQRLHRVRQREQERGRTLIGPHRDELLFRMNDFEVRRYASQGQHRTFGMALKLAQYLYLRDRLDETPLLLLDDVFGNLDPHRTDVFLRLLQTDTIGQSLITTTHRAPFEEAVAFDQTNQRAIAVQAGAVHLPETVEM